MENLITIFHGSPQIVEVPTFGLGRKNNDFGLGFYCIESKPETMKPIKPTRTFRRKKTTACICRIS